jgi:hypothetical protein
MVRLAVFLVILCVPLFSTAGLCAQYHGGLLVSEHVRMKIPVERQWLGRETMADLERCWSYVNGALDGKMPRRVLVTVLWESHEGSTDYGESSISIGMAHPAASADMKSFVLHRAAVGMARLGLAELSKKGTLREESQFLAEGMCEMIAREYRQSTRGLAGAWVLAHFLDRTKLLGLVPQSSWSTFSRGRLDLRAVSPGVTLVATLRELYGRERTIKLFEAMKKEGLEEALTSTFRSPARVLEQAWIKKVRDYRISDEVTVTSDENAPRLRQMVSGTARPGGNVQLRLSIEDIGQDFSPTSLFVLDEASGQVIEGKTGDGGRFVVVQIPIDSKRPAGKCNVRITAVDDSGNVRHWDGSYDVKI